MPKGQACLLFAHAPHTQKVGKHAYQEYWEEVWRAIVKYADPQLTMFVMDANQPARAGDRLGRRMEEGLRDFYGAHGLRDVTDVLLIPEGAYSCVKGTEKSRIDTAAVTENTKVRLLEAGSWGSSALSDWHTPMMIIAAWPEEKVRRPRAKVRMCAHEQHMKNVELSRDELISYKSSLVARKQPEWEE